MSQIFLVRENAFKKAEKPLVYNLKFINFHYSNTM